MQTYHHAKYDHKLEAYKCPKAIYKTSLVTDPILVLQTHSHYPLFIYYIIIFALHKQEVRITFWFQNFNGSNNLRDLSKGGMIFISFVVYLMLLSVAQTI